MGQALPESLRVVVAFGLSHACWCSEVRFYYFQIHQTDLGILELSKAQHALCRHKGSLCLFREQVTHPPYAEIDDL